MFHGHLNTGRGANERSGARRRGARRRAVGEYVVGALVRGALALWQNVKKSGARSEKVPPTLCFEITFGLGSARVRRHITPTLLSSKLLSLLHDVL
jgi:hypothetical protein